MTTARVPSRRATFVENLKLLNQDEHLEIVKILRKDHIAFSENSNGIYFPMSIIGDELFARLETFVVFCLENRKTLKERDSEMAQFHVDTDRTVEVPDPVAPPMAPSVAHDTRDVELQRYKTGLKPDATVVHHYPPMPSLPAH